jgi:hypothetical protein
MSLMQTVSVEAYHEMGDKGLIGKDTKTVFGPSRLLAGPSLPELRIDLDQLFRE